MDYNKLINKSLLDIKPSGIRRFFDIAAEMKEVISLGIGEPDFFTPWHIRDAGIRSLETGHTHYTANSGLQELREEISKYIYSRQGITYDPRSEILVTVGGSEALDLAIRSLVNCGDEVLIPEPAFVCYDPITTIAGGIPVKIETKVENNFRLTARELKEAITDKTKLLVLPYPNNPTGAVMRRRDLEEIAEVLRGTDIIVLSDEIYGELTYGDTPHVSIASIEGMQEKTIVVNGFSKAYAMTGWRLGYICAPAPLTKAMTKLHQYAIMSSPTVSQYAAVEALKNGDEDIESMRQEYDRRRRLVVDGFRSIELDCFEPEGAFYVFPCIRSTGLSSEDFCEQLLHSQHVAVIPGTAFGECGQGFVRVSYCYSAKHLLEALDRIERFLKSLRGR
ncbi:MAG: aminotransferase class I/II-fold pyridoxal phosphate-dependent enzyme [Clostridia bacterium]|nr:aminotransferase class I/II-fold pyridoxal phosphate-dependent enzyme [Clostridia bacterium]